jgi:hypothetical protein
MHVAKWPDLEAEVKNWTTDHTNSEISVFTKMIIFGVRRWMVRHGIPVLFGTASWYYSCIKRYGL